MLFATTRFARSLSLWTLGLLALLFPACGGGGGEGAPDPTLMTLHLGSYDEGRAMFIKDEEFLVENGPGDVDPDRWAMTYNGAHGLFFMRKAESGPPMVYRYYPLTERRFSFTGVMYPIIGAGTDVDLGSMATLYADGRWRLYFRSKSRPQDVHQFLLHIDTRRFEYLSTISSLNTPSDTDYDRWAMHHDGTTYRQMFFKEGSSTTIYQAGYSSVLNTYLYGWASAPTVILLGFAPLSASDRFASFHDGSRARIAFASR